MIAQSPFLIIIQETVSSQTSSSSSPFFTVPLPACLHVICVYGKRVLTHLLLVDDRLCLTIVFSTRVKWNLRAVKYSIYRKNIIYLNGIFHLIICNCNLFNKNLVYCWLMMMIIVECIKIVDIAVLYMFFIPTAPM